MKHLLSALLVFASMSPALAQQAKVIKVKGQQAIVQFPNGTVPVVGELINLSGGGTNAETGAHVSNGSREHFLGGSALISALSPSPGTGTNITFDITGRYGWNLHTIEFGPIARLYYFSQPGTSTTTPGVGGFFDFNFVPNVSGNTFIYGVGAEAYYEQQSQSLTSGSTTSTSLIRIFAAGNIKYFGLNDHLGLRADAGFDYERSSVSGGSTSSPGLLIRGGVYTYF